MNRLKFLKTFLLGLLAIPFAGILKKKPKSLNDDRAEDIFSKTIDIHPEFKDDGWRHVIVMIPEEGPTALYIDGVEQNFTGSLYKYSRLKSAMHESLYFWLPPESKILKEKEG